MAYSDEAADQINYHGTSVTLRSVTRAYSKYGDETESNVDTSITVVINSLSAEDDVVKEGIVRSGDYRFFCKKEDATGLVTGNKIVHNGVTHLIVEVLPREINGELVQTEVLTKRE